jgi:hypothetical protein
MQLILPGIAAVRIIALKFMFYKMKIKIFINSRNTTDTCFNDAGNSKKVINDY